MICTFQIQEKKKLEITPWRWLNVVGNQRYNYTQVLVYKSFSFPISSEVS